MEAELAAGHRTFIGPCSLAQACLFPPRSSKYVHYVQSHATLDLEAHPIYLAAATGWAACLPDPRMIR